METASENHVPLTDHMTHQLFLLLDNGHVYLWLALVRHWLTLVSTG